MDDKLDTWMYSADSQKRFMRGIFHESFLFFRGMYKLGTKAETLQTLYQKLKYAEVLPQYSFTVTDWKRDSHQVLEKYRKLGWNQNVIVRSSSLAEDTSQSSHAGRYESIANVRNKATFEQAVNTVISSYDDENGKNQILVQPMLANVRICGVAFTLDPNTLGNYYVINYDEQGSTSAITAGQGTDNKLYYRFKGYEKRTADESKLTEMDRLCFALEELEVFFGQKNLDVEFAFAQDGVLYILQVRALCIHDNPIECKMQKEELERIANKINRDQQPKPFLCGEKTIYSVMTDWNPAEMIGIRPKPLALSLYREIITDNVWAYQRDNYGYRNLRSFPLMVDFCGLPYIDVRVSFNSFIPAELEEELSEKLINYYINRLTENPQKHDKAEFEIVFSCYTLDLPERIQVLKQYGFSEEEIQKIIEALRNVTNHIIHYDDGLWRKDYAKIDVLNKRFEEIINSNLEDIEKVYWLLEDCKRYGTLPFAGLARGAFIAVQILQSLVSCRIISKSDYEVFMNGVKTVSSNMNADYKDLTKSAFLKKYGHLRPGTYDINSRRYDEAPELYFEWKNSFGSEKPESDKEVFKLSLTQLELLKKKLQENGLTNDILELMDFIKQVIEGREYGKFAFTRNLSKAIQLIEGIGRKEGITKQDMAFLDIHAVYELYASSSQIGTKFFDSIIRGKKKYLLTRSITLPPVIVGADDVAEFYYPDSEPNFITSGTIAAEVYMLENEPDTEAMNGKIILMQSADPGFDWIFSHGIKGFVTMYGGANSHMAIRAGELGIPAAVGVGAKIYEKCKKSKILELDAINKQIKFLR